MFFCIYLTIVNFRVFIIYFISKRLKINSLFLIWKSLYFVSNFKRILKWMKKNKIFYFQKKFPINEQIHLKNPLKQPQLKYQHFFFWILSSTRIFLVFDSLLQTFPHYMVILVMFWISNDDINNFLCRFSPKRSFDLNIMLWLHRYEVQKDIIMLLSHYRFSHKKDSIRISCYQTH